MTLLEAALLYAHHGIHVFPVHGIRSGACTCRKPDCSQPGKHPVLKGGFKAATRDAQEIRTWWTQWPEANIGIPTGKESGWYVLDIDPRHGGMESMKRLKEEHQLPDVSLLTRTGGGGLHLIYGPPQSDALVQIGTNIGGYAGVDFRGDGGYIVAPPSRHYSGGIYQWHRDRGFPPQLPLISLPAAIVALIQLRRPLLLKDETSGPIPEGQRNERLFKYACKLQNEGRNDADILALVMTRNTEACRPPLPQPEVKQIVTSVTTRYPKGSLTSAPSSRSGGKSPTGDASSETLLELALIHDEFWHDTLKQPYATIRHKGHREHWALDSSTYREHLSRLFFEATERGATPLVLDTALATLKSMAVFEGNEYPVFLRTARQDDTIYIDLTNPEWQIVAITPQEWRLLGEDEVPPVRFRRNRTMEALPQPISEGSFEALSTLLNVSTPDQLVLLKGWLTFALHPEGPYPILMVDGPAGSAKTSLSRVLRSVIDPNVADTVHLNENDRDIMIRAKNVHLLSFDNVTGFSQETSNLLCGLATGTAYVTRQLYTDDEEQVFKACRPIIMTSINAVTRQADLADRSLRLTLSPVTKRLSEKELKERLGKVQPELFSAVLGAMRTALEREKQTLLPTQDIRMQDFVQWATAAEPALGLEAGGFLRAYEANRGDVMDGVAETNVLITLILRLLEIKPSWEGTASELLSRLDAIANEREKQDRSYPKVENWVSRRLNELRPVLKTHQVDYEPPVRKGAQGSKVLRLSKQPLLDSNLPPLPPSEEPATEQTTTPSRIANQSEDNQTSAMSPASMEVAAPGKDTSVSASVGNREGNYQYLTQLAEAESALAALAKTSERVGLDIETTGLDPLQDRIRLIQLAVPGRPTLILDLFALGDLKALAPWLSRLRCVSHNAVFEASFLKFQGVDLLPECTLLAHHALTGEARDLKSLMQHYLGRELDKTPQTSDWSQPNLTPEQLRYAALDAEVLPPLFDKIGAALLKQGSHEVYVLMQKAQVAVVAMRLQGIAFDSKAHAKLIQEIQDRSDRLFQRMKLERPDINPNSPKQLTDWLCKECPADLLADWPKTKTGQLSTSTEVLKEQVPYLPEHTRNRVVELLLPWRQESKKLSSFGESLSKHIHSQTGRLHASFNLAGAVTGRMSCASPNLQQIPRDRTFRCLFQAAPGCHLIIADYSQMELRIAALLAEEPVLLDAYARGDDVHRLTAARLLGKDPSDVTAEDRQLAKAVNFGLLYGQQYAGLKRYAEASYGVRMSDEEAIQHRERWFASYPAIQRWHQESWETAQRKLCVITPSGRVRRFKSRRREDMSPMEVYNTPVQGGAAEVLLKALGLLMPALRNAGLTAQPVAVVHDEILLESPEREADIAARVLQRVMEEAMTAIFPEACTRGLVEAKIVRDWSEK
jgi:DNA polymerase-1